MSANSTRQIPVIPVAAGPLTRQEEHKAALLRNAQIREHYKFEEIVDMENKHDLKFFECALWAIPVCALAWAVIIWGLYKLLR